jgi:hypothetical protein
MRYRFEMLDVVAGGIPAQVVNLQAVWHGTERFLVGEDVDVAAFPVGAALAVASLGRCPCPDDAVRHPSSPSRAALFLSR